MLSSYDIHIRKQEIEGLLLCYQQIIFLLSEHICVVKYFKIITLKIDICSIIINITGHRTSHISSL